MLSCCWCSDFSSSCLLLFILRNFDKMLSYCELYKVPSLILSQQVAIIIFSFNFSFWFSLQPSGGSGTYIWSSCNTSVATVSTKGVVITTNAVGHTQARAADMKNLAIFGTAEVGSQPVLNTPSSCRVIGVQLPWYNVYTLLIP